VVYGTDRIPIQTMFKEGLVLNVIGAVVISSLLLWLLPLG
jgi:di/tricarboxylate transporter